MRYLLTTRLPGRREKQTSDCLPRLFRSDIAIRILAMKSPSERHGLELGKVYSADFTEGRWERPADLESRVRKRLVDLYKAVDRNADTVKVRSRILRFFKEYTHRDEGPIGAEPDKLFMPRWKDAWNRDGYIGWGLIGRPEGNETVRLLVQAFESLARFAFDATTDRKTTKHRSAVLDAVGDYLDHVGVNVEQPIELDIARQQLPDGLCQDVFDVLRSSCGSEVEWDDLESCWGNRAKDPSDSKTEDVLKRIRRCLSNTYDHHKSRLEVRAAIRKAMLDCDAK